MNFTQSAKRLKKKQDKNAVCIIICKQAPNQMKYCFPFIESHRKYGLNVAFSDTGLRKIIQNVCNP